jgi:hypothetical protein
LGALLVHFDRQAQLTVFQGLGSDLQVYVSP